MRYFSIVSYLNIFTRNILHHSRKQLRGTFALGNELEKKKEERNNLKKKNYYQHKTAQLLKRNALVDSCDALTPTILFMASSLSDSLLLSNISLRSSFLRTEDILGVIVVSG